MEKIKLGGKALLYPMPTTIIGANVQGKPNYLTIAWCTIVEHSPAMFLFSSVRSKHTLQGVVENQTFSVNIPSVKLIRLTDYVGIYSGKTVDKSAIFDSFYGQLQTAPMIEECPVNLECRLVKIVDIGTAHELFVGEIVETYADSSCLTNGLPDLAKIKPLLFTGPDNSYWETGGLLAKAWDIGKEQ